MSASSDWIHCNQCYRTPQTAGGMPFYFSNCGHLHCLKCISPDGKSKTSTCPVCQKQCGFVEINRNLRPEIQMLFRNPRDLAQQFMDQMKRTLDFQGSNRTRLHKHVTDKANKVMKYAEGARTELKRLAELEKKAAEETQRLRQENQKYQQQYAEISMKCRSLEVELASSEQQLEQIKSINRSDPNSVPRNPMRSESGYSSSSINTTFQEFITSTPIHAIPHRPKSSERRTSSAFFGNAEISPIIGGNVLNTPALLGLPKKPHRSSSAGRKHEQKDAFAMDIDII